MPKNLSQVSTLEAELKEAIQEEKDATKALRHFEAKRKMAQLALFEAKYGVRVGSIVKNGKSVEFLITSVSSCLSEPWMKGKSRNKDGTWSKNVRTVGGNWTLVES